MHMYKCIYFSGKPRYPIYLHILFSSSIYRTHTCSVLHSPAVFSQLCCVVCVVCCRMSCVCHSWRQAVSDDKESRERRLHYLELRERNKVVYCNCCVCIV